MKKRAVEFKTSPLADATIELRFEENSQSDFIAALIGSRLRSKFSTVTELGIQQLPLELRESEQFRYQPTLKLEDSNFYVNLGPRVIGLGCKIVPGEQKYPGWKVLLDTFMDIVREVEELNAIGSFTRLGVRFVNFLNEPNIFSYLNVDLSTSLGDIKENVVSFSVLHTEHTINVTIAREASKGQLQFLEKGQLIDIDASALKNEISFNDIKDLCNIAHGEIERVFFGLINEELGKKLGAKYV